MTTDDSVATDRSSQWRAGDGGLAELAGSAIRQARSHDLPGLAADIAFHATLALLPFILLLVSLPTVTGSVFSVSDPGQEVADRIGAVFSEDFGKTIQSMLDEVNESRGWTALLLGLGTALWAGTSTIGTVRKALNRIHECEDEGSFVRRKLTDLGLTLLTGVMFFSAIVAGVAGPALLGLSGALSEVLFIVYGLVAATVTASVIYLLAPASDGRFRWVTPGAVLFVVAWLISSLGFSFYLSNINNLNHVYGTLGIMAIAIIWLYLSAFSLLVGAEINALLTKHAEGPTDTASVLN